MIKKPKKYYSVDGKEHEYFIIFSDKEGGYFRAWKGKDNLKKYKKGKKNAFLTEIDYSVESEKEIKRQCHFLGLYKRVEAGHFSYEGKNG